MKLNTWFLVVVVTALVGSACGGETSGTGEGPSIVVTTSILGDVVDQIVGDDATVEVLMTAGTDPHDYSPSARDAETISSASLVVANGLGLEEGLTDMLESAESDGVPVLEVGPLIDPIPFDSGSEDDEDHDEDAEHEADETEHEHQGDDPHFWQDPTRMITATAAIAEALSDVAPGTDWQERATAYQQRLSELDAEVVELLADIPADRRVMVTNHDALGYFADRYDLQIVGVVIPGGSTLAEPSAADLAALVDTLRALAVRAIFVENTVSPALAETVAAELGSDVTIASLYTGSLGEPDGPAGDYIGMIRTNAETIAAALGANG